MSEKKRNIVLITLDSVRADHCSFMGYHRKTTPTIDKMVRKGLYFENAIASGVATPTSMFGVHTGTYSLSSYAVDKLYGNEWRKEIQSKKTLAQVLRRVGYYTGAIHANPAASSFFGFNKGFDYFQDFLKENKSRSKNTIAKLLARTRFHTFLENMKAIINKELTSTDWRKYIPYIEDFRKEANKENKPYFLWILLLDTHIPYIAPKEARKWSSKSTAYLIYLNWKVRKNYLNAQKVAKLINRAIDAYDDTILYADRFIYELWELLKDDDPIFIIHADHGEGFGEHGFLYHPPLLYEELIHVPLVIYNADVKGKIDKPVSLLSLAPTILELTGEKDEFPSKSLLHYNKEWVISQVIEDERMKIAVRMKDWKFIKGQKDKDELYYLKKDPHEQENILDNHPDLVGEMRKIVELHVKQERERERIRKGISRLRGI